jgi:hypothetical protein
MTNPIFALPAYRVGPYTMKTTPKERGEFNDKRRILEHDWTGGRTFIASDLSQRKAMECLVRSLVTTIHYRSGLNDKSDEESFTHSLATGLVELALNNPEFWTAFQQLLEAEYKPGAGWGRTAAGSPVLAARSAPSRIVMDHRSCTINWVPAAEWPDEHAYGFYYIKQGRIDICDDLYGTNQALVVLHEVFHFLHECIGLKDSTKEVPFKRCQALMLLRFVQQNPKFWAWWLNAVKPRKQELRLAA